MEHIAMPAINFAAIMPEVILSVVAMALLLVNVFVPSKDKGYLGWLSIIGLAVTCWSAVSGWNAPPELQTGFNGAVLQDNFAIFFKVMLPLLTPALAAFGIFQFLWVWNDLLVALTFAGGGQSVAPITLQLANLSGTRGTAWQLLSAGAFVSIIVPVTVFLLLQRFFVRGILSGSVKG